MSADGTIPEAATLLADKGDARVYHATWQQLAKVVGQVDTLIVDAPYSERTHAGHDAGTGKPDRDLMRSNGESYGAAVRRTIDYAAWGPADVADFVEAWCRRTVGWFVTITDHVLSPTWFAEFDRCGRYAFAPMPFVAPGSRVRLSGDGPSNWTTWIVVARPRTKEAAKWGTLPGAYVLPPGHSERMQVVGGKPAWLMERLVSDYSRPGDLVADPCCGAGTTLTAAVRVGRRAVGGDMKREHAEMAARAVNSAIQTPLFGGAA